MGGGAVAARRALDQQPGRVTAGFQHRGAVAGDAEMRVRQILAGSVGQHDLDRIAEPTPDCRLAEPTPVQTAVTPFLGEGRVTGPHRPRWRRR